MRLLGLHTTEGLVYCYRTISGGLETRAASVGICVLAAVPGCLTMPISINYMMGVLLILITVLEIGIIVFFFFDKKIESRKTIIDNLTKGTFLAQVFLNPNLFGFKS